jgi:hypothetical protein
LAVVCKCVTAPNLNNQFNIFGISNSATGRGGTSLGYNSTTRTRRIAMNRVSDGAAGNATFGAAAADTWELWVVRVTAPSNGDAATVTARVSGVVETVAGTTYANVVDNNAGFFLGSAISNGNCAVRYVKAWNRALNNASILRLESDITAAGYLA